MKKYAVYIIALLIASMSYSCNKDLGNYDYIALDSLMIEGLPKTIKVSLGQPLSIAPTIDSKVKDIDPKDLAYEWTTFDKGAANNKQQRKVLSTDASINRVLPLLVGTYSSYYIITQTSTGRRWIYPFTIEVEGVFGKYGWFILHDKEEQAHVDFFQDDAQNWNTYPTIYRDFTNLLVNEVDGKTMVLEGNGTSLTAGQNRDGAALAVKDYLYVNTTGGTKKINMTDGYLYNTTKYNFQNEVAGANPRSADRVLLTSYSGGEGYVIKDQDLYSQHVIMGRFYNVPLNRDVKGTLFPISKHVVLPSWNVMMNILVYDTKGKRFLRSDFFSSVLAPISSKGQAFDAEDVGMDLVWMQHTEAFSGQGVALFSKGTDFFLVRMGFNSMGNFQAQSMENVTSKLTDIGQAKHFLVDDVYGYLFYTAGDKLYQYDMDAKVLKVAETFSGRTASMLRKQYLTQLTPGSTRYNDRKERLDPFAQGFALGTYDEKNPKESGKVQFFRVSGLMAPLTKAFKDFEGFGKVVDVVYTDIL